MATTPSTPSTNSSKPVVRKTRTAKAQPKVRPEEIRVDLAFSYDTKPDQPTRGSFRYDAMDDDAPVRSLYIRKVGDVESLGEEITLVIINR